MFPISLRLVSLLIFICFLLSSIVFLFLFVYVAFDVSESTLLNELHRATCVSPDSPSPPRPSSVLTEGFEQALCVAHALRRTVETQAEIRVPGRDGQQVLRDTADDSEVAVRTGTNRVIISSLCLVIIAIAIFFDFFF